MLGENDIHPVVAVADLDTAKQFYTNTLGLKLLNEDENNAVVLQSGNSKLMLYVSDYAGTNEATTATWKVDDVASSVEELVKKNVVFEEYSDMQDVVIKGHVHVLGKTEAAWFRDPDGNILCISNTL